MLSFFGDVNFSQQFQLLRNPVFICCPAFFLMLQKEKKNDVCDGITYGYCHVWSLVNRSVQRSTSEHAICVTVCICVYLFKSSISLEFTHLHIIYWNQHLLVIQFPLSFWDRHVNRPIIIGAATAATTVSNRAAATTAAAATAPTTTTAAAAWIIYQLRSLKGQIGCYWVWIYIYLNYRTLIEVTMLSSVTDSKSHLWGSGFVLFWRRLGWFCLPSSGFCPPHNLPMTAKKMFRSGNAFYY